MHHSLSLLQPRDPVLVPFLVPVLVLVPFLVPVLVLVLVLVLVPLQLTFLPTLRHNLNPRLRRAQYRRK